MELLNGWQYYEYDEVASTNDTIKEYCTTKGLKVIVKANLQTAGRGRRGRSWLGVEGNLFFSLALETDLTNISRLVLISGLSLLKTIRYFSNIINVKIKWPNDILIEGCKVSGILLEKAQGDYLIIGIGVNIVGSPKEVDALYNITSLAENNVDVSSDEFLRRFIDIFTDNLEKYENENFEILRQEWLENAVGIGRQIIVRQEKQSEKKGVFIGLDENANLLLETANGIQKITAGDVFIGDENE
jgi:BirA family biotin operon repressor/biotin-[acetyl-CoA-carboxylase] ligase